MQQILELSLGVFETIGIFLGLGYAFVSVCYLLVRNHNEKINSKNKAL